MNTRGWLVGAAQAEFFVPTGMPMAGYAARQGNSIATLDPLMVSALWLDADGSQLVIVSADIASVDEALTRKVAEKAGIARDSLLLAASHTHSGPARVAHKLHIANQDVVDHALRRRFVTLCVEAIADARGRALPASLRLGRSSISGLASDRNDSSRLRESELTLLDIELTAGVPVASVVHWACHPTVLGAANRSISADFPGALRQELQRRAGRDDLAVIYLNGAAGNVSTRFTRRGQDHREVERTGRELAGAATIARRDTVSLQPILSHLSRKITLQGWTDSEIEAASYENIVTAPDQSTDRREATRRQGRELLRALAMSRCRPRRRTIRLDAWRLGEATVVAIPGELFSSLGERIEQAASGPVIVVGYAGGYAGYLPDRAAYEAGTYEALASPFGPGCGERVAEAAIEMVTALQTLGLPEQPAMLGRVVRPSDVAMEPSSPQLHDA